MLRLIILFVLFFLHLMGFSQDKPNSLSLQESIDISLKNNLDLKSTKLSSKTAEVVFKESRNDLLPNLNGNYSIALNNGKSIDPYSNSYIDEQLKSSNAGLRLNTTIFNGFRLLNSLKRDRLNMKAAQTEIEEAKQDLILNVTLTYLQILNNQDLVELAKSRQQTTLKQVDRLQALYDEGDGNPADYTDIKGQLANDKASVIEAKSRLTASQLQLAQLLNVDYIILPQPISTPEVFEKYNISSEQVMEDALNNLATFKAKELRIEAAKKDVNVSKSLFTPNILLFAQVNTNYSSAARLFTEAGTQQVESGGFITVNNQTIPVFTNQIQFSENIISYNDQFINNLNSVVGIEVNIPIFNGFQAKHAVEFKKIELEESKVDYENTKSKFQQSIKQAHAEMEASYERFQVLKDQVDAFDESYRVNEIRFTNGVSNIVEYIISKNNLDNAQINLANAKYEYLLRVKVLEYYRGNI